MDRLGSQIAAFRAPAGTPLLVVVLRGGDITTITLDDEKPIVSRRYDALYESRNLIMTGQIEIEGTVEPGILTASWSPDDSLLVLITSIVIFLLGAYTPTDLSARPGDGKLILMTSTFEVISEIQLHTAEFGEGVHSLPHTFVFPIAHSAET